MTKVYKCDYCTHTEEKKSKMKKHEKYCTKSEFCSRCKYSSFFFSSLYCENKKSDFYEVHMIAGSTYNQSDLGYKEFKFKEERK